MENPRTLSHDLHLLYIYICIYTHIHIYIFASKSGIEYFINSWDSRVDAWMFDNFYTVFPAAV